jgi:RNA polymerase sigma factor (sigma-70 family)
MAERSAAVLGQVLRSAVAGRSAGPCDRELLVRFAAGEQAAFAALFRRHAGMVLGVCRRVLAGEQDAEDACQATFLLLARKAKSGRWQPSVANWLYLTARRVARNARVTAERRARREQAAAVREAVQPVDRMTGRELLAVLDEELERLPPRYREPLVLCYLQGLTRDEAAAQLGILPGTLKSQLERGRKHLGDALTKRGFVAGAGLLVLAATSPAGASPPRLVAAVLAAATGTPTAAVAKLTRVTAGSGLRKKIAGLVVLGVSALGIGVAALPPAEMQRPAEKAMPAGAARIDPAPPAEPADRDLVVKGRVLGPDGKPVAGAKLMLPAAKASSFQDVVEVATTAADGSFHCTIKPTDPGVPDLRTLVARAPGFGADWVSVNELSSNRPVTLQLVPDDVPVRGRVVDMEGRPVPGATVTVKAVHASASGSLDAFLREWRTLPQQALAQVRKATDSPSAAGLPIKLTSDKDGRFEIQGVGRGRVLSLSFEARGTETAAARVVALPGFDPKSFAPRHGDKNPYGLPRSAPDLYGPDLTHVARPDAPVVGRITDAATDKPVAGVSIHGGVDNGWWENEAVTETDADGRYRLNGLARAERRWLTLWPDKHSSHLPAQHLLRDSPGLAETTADFQLVRGVVIDGHVVDKTSGKPVPGAVVYYSPLSDNQFFAKTPGSRVFTMTMRAISADANGAFRDVVLPGAGLITAEIEMRGSAAPVYYVQTTVEAADEPRLYRRVRDDLDECFAGIDLVILPLYGKAAYKVIEPAEGTESLKVVLQFERGRSVSGTVVGPDAKPAPGVVAHGLETVRFRPRTLAGASFRAVALDPRRPRLVAFVDAARKLAGATRLRGDEKEPPVVKLQPWAAISGRVVDGAGKPFPGVLLKQMARHASVDSNYHWVVRDVEATTDAAGRFRLDVPFGGGIAQLLVPSHDGKNLGSIRGLPNLDLAPGEVREVGDVTLKSE